MHPAGHVLQVAALRVAHDGARHPRVDVRLHAAARPGHDTVRCVDRGAMHDPHPGDVGELPAQEHGRGQCPRAARRQPLGRVVAGAPGPVGVGPADEGLRGAAEAVGAVAHPVADQHHPRRGLPGLGGQAGAFADLAGQGREVTAGVVAEAGDVGVEGDVVHRVGAGDVVGALLDDRDAALLGGRVRGGRERAAGGHDAEVLAGETAGPVGAQPLGQALLDDVVHRAGPVTAGDLGAGAVGPRPHDLT